MGGQASARLTASTAPPRDGGGRKLREWVGFCGPEDCAQHVVTGTTISGFFSVAFRRV